MPPARFSGMSGKNLSEEELAIGEAARGIVAETMRLLGEAREMNRAAKALRDHPQTGGRALSSEEHST